MHKESVTKKRFFRKIKKSLVRKNKSIEKWSKWVRWSSTHPSHSGSQTSRWRRSSRKGLVGRNEVPCTLAQSHMTAGSFGQTFLLCMLQVKREQQIHKYLFGHDWSSEKGQCLLNILTKICLLFVSRLSPFTSEEIVLCEAQTCLAACSHESWRAYTVSVDIMTHPAVQALWTVLVTRGTPLLAGTVYRQREQYTKCESKVKFMHVISTVSMYGVCLNWVCD